MPRLFDVKDVDRRFYREKLQGFLPERIVDVHCHVWLKSFCKAPPTGRAATWPLRVADQNPVEELLETYELLFPGKSVKPLMFSFVESHEDDFEEANAYISRAAREHGLAALVFASPRWSAERLEQEIVRGAFLGAKVYLTLSPAHIPVDEIRIFDFLPHEQLEVLNEHRWIVMLHIPRSGRLRDPVNLADLLEIERRYPNAKVIVAHAGRAYCPEDVGDAFAVLRETERLLFDISANTNATVFEQLIRTVGPRRILFGSDLPITRMRMRRVCEGGNYVNLVPQGLYGDVSDDKHMREVAGEQAGTLSFFLYEEIDAFRRAAQAAGLTRQDIEAVFYANALRLIESARPGGSLKAEGLGDGSGQRVCEERWQSQEPCSPEPAEPVDDGLPCGRERAGDRVPPSPRPTGLEAATREQPASHTSSPPKTVPGTGKGP